MSRRRKAATPPRPPRSGPTEIQLSRAEAETEGGLPPVCIRCGQPATRVVKRHYSNQLGAPSTFGKSLLAVIVLEAVTAGVNAMTAPCAMTVRMPVCRWHASHWTRWTVAVGVVFFVLVGSLMFHWFRTVSENPGGPVWGDETVLIGLVALVLAVVVSWWVSANFSPINFKNLSKQGITVTGVSPQFVTAVQALRQARARKP